MGDLNTQRVAALGQVMPPAMMIALALAATVAMGWVGCGIGLGRAAQRGDARGPLDPVRVSHRDRHRPRPTPPRHHTRQPASHREPPGDAEASPLIAAPIASTSGHRHAVTTPRPAPPASCPGAPAAGAPPARSKATSATPSPRMAGAGGGPHGSHTAHEHEERR